MALTFDSPAPTPKLSFSAPASIADLTGGDLSLPQGDFKKTLLAPAPPKLNFSSPAKEAPAEKPTGKPDELLPNDPNKNYAELLPMARDKTTGKRSLAVPGMIRDIVHTAEVPGRITAGEKISPEELQSSARDFALQMVAGKAATPEARAGGKAIPAIADEVTPAKTAEAAAASEPAASAPKLEFTPPPSIFSPDTPVASTKGIATPRGISDELYANLGRAKADSAELGKFLKDSGAYQVPRELDKKFGLHEDDPKAYPLTPPEQAAYDKIIKPMREEVEAGKKELLKKDYDPDDFVGEGEESGIKGGAIRQVVGKNTPMDRLLGTQEKTPLRQRVKAAMTPVSGRALSTKAGVVKPRNMFALDVNGKRTIVHIEDGYAYDAAQKDKLIGEVTDPNELEVKTPEGIGKIKDATRSEITAATEGRIQYHDQTTAVTATSLLQVRRAVRTARSLENLAKAPEAADVVREPAKGLKNIPKDWVEIPGVPAFRGKYFEPKFAEEIEDHLGAARRNMGELKALESLNRFAMSSLFWLNPAHAYNVAEAFAVTKGATGFLKDLPATASDFVKSLKSVATRDKMYMQQVRSGVPMRGIDSATEKFSADLLKSVQRREANDPQGFAAFAKKFGMGSKDLVSKIGQLSHDATFGLQDILQQTLERGLARKGVGQAQATEQIAKTLPSYRTPARLLGSRTLGKTAKGATWFQFPGWDVGRLQGMGNILKGSAKLDKKSLDQLLMIAVLYEFGKEVYDPAVQDITGNKQAEAPTAGYGVFPKAANDIYQGNKSIGQAAQSLMPLGYLPRAAAKFPIGADLYTGQKISLPGEKPSEIAYDYAQSFAKDIDPLRRLMDLQTGKGDMKSNIAEQLGFKVPTSAQEAGKAKAQKYNRGALKSKRKKEPDISDIYTNAVKALNENPGN